MTTNNQSCGASVFKTVGRTMGLALALPTLLGYAVGSVILGEQRAFSLASERLAVRGGQFDDLDMVPFSSLS